MVELVRSLIKSVTRGLGNLKSGIIIRVHETKGKIGQEHILEWNVQSLLILGIESKRGSLIRGINDDHITIEIK